MAQIRWARQLVFPRGSARDIRGIRRREKPGWQGVSKDRILRWAARLREEHEKTTREEQRKEEVIRTLRELAELTERRRVKTPNFSDRGESG